MKFAPILDKKEAAMVCAKTLDEIIRNMNIVSIISARHGCVLAGQLRMTVGEYEVDSYSFGWVSVDLVNDTIDHIV